MTIPALAPEDLEPEDPMLASKFALAIGYSVEMYEATEVCPRANLQSSRAHDTTEVVQRMLGGHWRLRG
jgi:hypothetical protein